MSFKDWFSSKAWFNAAHNHKQNVVSNINTTEANIAYFVTTAAVMLQHNDNSTTYTNPVTAAYTISKTPYTIMTSSYTQAALKLIPGDEKQSYLIKTVGSALNNLGTEVLTFTILKAAFKGANSAVQDLLEGKGLKQSLVDGVNVGYKDAANTIYVTKEGLECVADYIAGASLWTAEVILGNTIGRFFHHDDQATFIAGDNVEEAEIIA